jgi:CRP-like cAMP-binding protein
MSGMPTAAGAATLRRLTGADLALHPNRLLRGLPPEECDRLGGVLRVVPLEFKRVLQRQDELIRWIYFPQGGVVSVVTVMHDGRMVEAATVGNEGFVDVGAALGATRAQHEILVQVPGADAHAMPIDVFRRELAQGGMFAERVSRYSQAFLSLVTQSIACNGLHSVEQRCCRWLLMTSDRMHEEDFPLTQEFLAVMLGVRRASVHAVVRELRTRELIRYGRRRVRIINRGGVEELACECYGVVRGHFDRLLP